MLPGARCWMRPFWLFVHITASFRRCPHEWGTDPREKFELRFADGLDIPRGTVGMEKEARITRPFGAGTDPASCVSFRVKLESKVSVPRHGIAVLRVASLRQV